MVSDIFWAVLFVVIAVAILFFFIRMVKKSMNGCSCGCGCSGCSSARKCAELGKKRKE